MPPLTPPIPNPRREGISPGPYLPPLPSHPAPLPVHPPTLYPPPLSHYSAELVWGLLVAHTHVHTHSHTKEKGNGRIEV